mmetsp:Transcript_6723/g.14839  ORF Transcript_6723/g.14839 Transcript_6723/m.14839 type:complete len:209 (-) Transcript_6723:569-1195(-)|eukprot:CAMPEP_0202903436 /NCGR_PEP_ID=MMETSP1392-20130828/24420_1 /ASSEMBLY_ACC=CAM_ASM_000868 /TAXON_ID=225041 /ORGANISM="Chlamydomonas chlamydogama, Strain SAG 11-48b" /LENGTH=208 /DNA_ID=CAMNT_0049590613 /DNA_START=57 /DNA_END=683 /DNA_ORIENTATION=-
MLDVCNPDELLALETLVPTEFRHGAYKLGKELDPGSSDRDVKEGAQLEVPLWIALPLAKMLMTNVKLPAVYSDRYRRKLNAGAECVSLKNRAPYFYEVGNRCNDELKDVELSGFLMRTFKTRYHELISKGLNTMTGEEILELHSKLSAEEQQLFEGGRLSTSETDRWLRGDSSISRFKMMRRKRTADHDTEERSKVGEDATKQQRQAP